MRKLYLSLAIFAFLLIGGWMAHSQTQRSNAVRQTWEYTWVSWKTVGDAGVNKLGADGWELVTVQVRNQDEFYYFKRPKQ